MESFKLDEVTKRQDRERAITAVRATLVKRGPAFSDVDAPPFSCQLSGFYVTWKKQIGARCWSLLESAARLVARMNASSPSL